MKRSDRNMTGSISFGFYSVYIDNPHSVEPVVDLHKLADALPHGSGIDGDWNIKVQKNGNLIASSSFHRMNDVGYYDGWVDFSFRIYRATKYEPIILKGPAKGKVQLFKVKGQVYTSPVRGCGRNGESIREYLNDEIAFSLCDKFPQLDDIRQIVTLDEAKKLGVKL